MNGRYTVRRENTMLGVMFQVIDSWQGSPVGTPKYFEDEANRMADRLNIQMELK